MKCILCDGEVKLISQQATINFKGKDYQATEEFYECKPCNDRFWIGGLRDCLKEVYEQYRAENNLPNAEQIKSLRLKLDLTEEQFGERLECSARDVRMFERGTLPPDKIMEKIQCSSQ